jgi:hypothetical protein
MQSPCGRIFVKYDNKGLSIFDSLSDTKVHTSVGPAKALIMSSDILFFTIHKEG